MTLFDLICLGVLGLSGLAGFLRGAAREVANVVSFIVATIVALYALRFTGSIARDALNPDWMANVVAVIAVFVVVYIALRLAAAAIGRRLQDAHGLTVIDRAIGLAFGIVRGLVILGAFHLALNLATPAERMPGWIKDAAFYPVTAACADILRAFAPQGSRVAGQVAPVLERAVRDGRTPAGESEEQRRAMDDLVERSR